jgi:hypothetical protein
MAVKEVRVCDVYPPREAKPVLLELSYDGAIVAEAKGDLSERGLDRLKKFIAKGFASPKQNKAPEATT